MQTNECNVTYELVKPEELNPKERAWKMLNKYYHEIFFDDTEETEKIAHEPVIYNISKRLAKKEIEQILNLPLIGTGRMQPESFEDLKYWKEVLNELEKM